MNPNPSFASYSPRARPTRKSEIRYPMNLRDKQLTQHRPDPNHPLLLGCKLISSSTLTRTHALTKIVAGCAQPPKTKLQPHSSCDTQTRRRHKHAATSLVLDTNRTKTPRHAKVTAPMRQHRTPVTSTAPKPLGHTGSLPAQHAANPY